MRIIELRQYARVKQAVDDASEETQMPKGPMVDLVMEIEAELYRERAERLAEERAERLRLEAGGA